MELIVKVNVKEIENKKNKFNVYNTYIKDTETGEWVKFNVKFKAGEPRPETDSYVYANEEEISINEIGNYPTLFINKVNKIVKLRFDGKNLQKYFKTVEEKLAVDEDDEECNFFKDEEVKKDDLPF